MSGSKGSTSALAGASSRAVDVGIALVLVLLSVATFYEVLVASKVIRLGSLPGEGPPGNALAGFAAAVGILAAGALAAALATRSPQPRSLPAFLAPMAGAYLLAYFYTFDPYYLPTLMRYAARDFVSHTLVFALVGLSLGAGLLTSVRPRVGLALSSPLIVACGLVAWYSGVGH
jgi:hypothetical protein